jgi:hypothetical protein
MDSSELVTYATGVLTTLIWFCGAAFAWYRRRALLVPGFMLAGVVTLAITLATAFPGLLPRETLELALAARVLVAGLIVGSFIAAQPRYAGRPHRWLP